MKSNTKPKQTQRAQKPSEAPRNATGQNAYAALKGEISRVARKETRGETQSLKKTATQHRSDIAALKRRVSDLERLVRRLGRAAGKGTTDDGAAEVPSKFRFSASGLAAQRKRLGLSAAEMGTLIGVSGQSIYHWEQAKARPRASQLPAIGSIRKMGKREAAAKLAESA